MKPITSAGGWTAVGYTLQTARHVGWVKLWRAMRSRNACKTCALGMGGQGGGMVNEAGHFPEVCKKSLQAMAADMQNGISSEFFARYSLAELRTLSPRELESCGRLTTPIHAAPGDTHYQPVSWDEALDRLAITLRSTPPERSFFYSSGRSSNEAGFLLQLLARAFGTNNVNSCSYYCHQASSVGLGASVGTGTPTVQLDDLEHSDLFILIGGNPASNHPRLLRSLMSLRRRGGHVIVINPAKEVGLVNFRVPSDPRSLLFGTAIASEYVQPHIGGDVALLTGIARLVLDRGGCDHEFISQHTEGFDAFRTQIETIDWEAIQSASGVDRRTMARVADMYMSAQNVVIGWTMGITHHLNGVDNVQMIANLALLRGMVGRPHAGLLPIRGHSNVQGIGTVGATPALKQAVLTRLEARLGLRAPASAGLDTMGCIEAAGRGEMDTAVCLGGNLFGSSPDASYASEALGRLEAIAYLSTSLNTGHAWGTAKETWVLPVLPRDEEPEPTTQESMFSYIRLSDGGPRRHASARSEVSVLSGLAQRVLPQGPVDWAGLESHQRIRELIADLVPGLEQMSQIDQTRREFYIPGRRLDSPTFPTPSGKAQFQAISLPPATPLTELQLRLMTVRSEGQFNTVVFEEEDIYRGQERRDVILMNPSDMTRLGLSQDQRVTVRSTAGEVRGQRVRRFDVRAGNAMMYYPEANVLVPRDVDRRSKTPAFKSVVVEIEPATGGVSVMSQSHTDQHDSRQPSS